MHLNGGGGATDLGLARGIGEHSSTRQSRPSYGADALVCTGTSANGAFRWNLSELSRKVSDTVSRDFPPSSGEMHSGRDLSTPNAAGGVMRFLRFALGLAVVGALGVAVPPAADAAGSVSSYQQCKNDGQPVPYTTCDWVNGGLNASNHYAEDQVLPQRVVFNATSTSPNTLTVTYDDLKGGTVHGFDYLATWNHTQSAADVCAGLTGAAAAVCAGTPSTAPMMSDGASSGGSVVSAHELPAADRQWTIYGATITNVGAITHTSSQGVATITFQTTAPGPVVIAFGGHLAVGTPASAPRSWGDGSGAHDWPGGSLSMDVGGPNNSINTGAIAALPPASFSVRKTASTATAAAGDTVTYTVTVTNTGGTAGSTSFTDNYADNTTIGALPAGCTDSTTGTGTSADKQFTCTTGSINPGDTQTYTYDLTMPTSLTGTSGGSGCTTGTYPVTNTVGGAAGSGVATVCVAAAPQLALEKNGALHTDGSGNQLITYLLTWTNTGSAEATSVALHDPVPTGTRFVSCDAGCVESGGMLTWTLGSVPAGTGYGSLSFVVEVTGNQVCTVTNTASIQAGSAAPVVSNTVSTNVVPVPDPTGANARGSGEGVKVVTGGLLNLLVGGTGGNALGYATSTQTGPGGPVVDHDQVLTAKVPANGSVLNAGAITTTSASAVTSAPAEARQLSTAEIAKVCVVPVAGVCTVETNTLRAVAATMANGTTSSVSTAGSTIQNLKVVGLGVPVDLNQTTKITLNPLVFGPGSYVAINERQASTGLSAGKLTADMTVTMIHVKITGLLRLQAADIVIGRATAHSEFLKSAVCNPTDDAVSGHALVAGLDTGPLATNVIQGFVQISPLGGADEQHVARVTLPADGSLLDVKAADSSSVGTLSSAGAAAVSVAEVAGDGTGPLCLLRAGSSCAIEATAIRSEARSAADGTGDSTSTDGGTTLVNLKVLGAPVPLDVAPNTTINLPGIGFVVLNEQTCDGGGAAIHQCSGYPHSGITVRAVHVVVNVLDNVLGLAPGIELVVAEAHADSTFR
jgi:uncharacterized repeat protein (TIGR01451 family)